LRPSSQSDDLQRVRVAHSADAFIEHHVLAEDLTEDRLGLRRRQMGDPVLVVWVALGQLVGGAALQHMIHNSQLRNTHKPPWLMRQNRALRAGERAIGGLKAAVLQ